MFNTNPTVILVLTIIQLLIYARVHCYFNPDVKIINELFDDELGSSAKLANNGIASISVCVVHKNHILFTKGYGQLNPLKSSLPVDGDSIFSIGSITKTFTGTSIMKLYQDGHINLTSSVNDYIRDFKPIQPYIIGNYDSWDGRPVIQTDRIVSVANLLTHTAGLDERYGGTAAFGAQDQLPLSSYLEKNTPPRIREPGVVSVYSNHGIALLGLIVQYVSKLPFPEYLSRHIFEPLNMNSTFYGYSDTLDRNIHLATPCTRLADGSFNVIENYGKYMNIAPAVAIYSTTNDLAKYAIMHLSYGAVPGTNITILNQSIAREMYSTQFSSSDKLRGEGYTWYQNEVNFVPFISHQGELAPYYSQLSLFHQDNVALIFLMSGDNTFTLNRLRSEFIARTMYKTTFCSRQDEIIDPSTGYCFRSFLRSAVQPISPDFATRWKRYTGCYVSSDIIHTGYMKALMIQNPVYCIKRSGNFLVVAATMGYVLSETQVNLFNVNFANTMDTAALWYDLSNSMVLSFLDSKGVPLDSNRSAETGHAHYFVIHQQAFEYMPHITSPTMLLSLRNSFLFILLLLVIMNTLIGFSFLARDALSVYNHLQENRYYDIDVAIFHSDDIYYDERGEYFPEYHRFMRKKAEKLYQEPPSPKILVSTVVVTGLTVTGLCVFSILDLVNLIHIKNMTVLYHVSPQPLFVTLPLVSDILQVLTLLTLMVCIILRLHLHKHFGYLFTVLLVTLSGPTLGLNALYTVFISYFNIFPV